MNVFEAPFVDFTVRKFLIFQNHLLDYLNHI